MEPSVQFRDSSAIGGSCQFRSPLGWCFDTETGELGLEVKHIWDNGYQLHARLRDKRGER
jgi:hypothetical protein